MLAVLDWWVIGSYLLFLLLIGALLSRRQETGADYFVAGRSERPLNIALSVLATQCSTNSILGAPAFVAFAVGGGLVWLQYELAVPLAMIFAMVFVIPVFQRLKLISVYEYLENRFDLSTRLLLSAVFQVLRLLAAAVTIYGVSAMIDLITGVGFLFSVLLFGAFTVLYDVLGGIRAVIWSDVMQMGLLVGVLCYLLWVLAADAGGMPAMLAAMPEDRLEALDFAHHGLGDGLRPEILQRHLDVVCGIAPNRGEALDGGHTGILRHNGHETLAGQQAFPVVEQGIPHARTLPFREGVDTLVIGVVHVVVDHRFRAVEGTASCTSRGGRRVTHLIPLRIAVGLFSALTGEAKRVEQPQVMAHFVGQGFVEVIVVEQVIFFPNAEDTLVQHDAVIETTHWREVGEAQRRHAAVQTGHDPDVDVVLLGPVAQCLQVVLRGRMEVFVRDHALLDILGDSGCGIDPNDARGRVAFRIPARQFELNFDVHTTKLSSKVCIQRVNRLLYPHI